MENEIKELANAIFHEARGESREGQIAVGHVILNRVKDRRYPDTVRGVVWQPKQFSGVRYHGGWRRFEQLARDLLDGKYASNVGKSLSFRSFRPKSFRFRIGNHYFW